MPGTIINTTVSNHNTPDLSISHLTSYDDTLDLDLTATLDQIEEALGYDDTDPWEVSDLRLMRTSGPDTLDRLATRMAMAGRSA